MAVLSHILELERPQTRETLDTNMTGVNGTDNIRSYSSLDSFRGVNIRPYSSPGIQYPTPYPNTNTETGFL